MVTTVGFLFLSGSKCHAVFLPVYWGRDKGGGTVLYNRAIILIGFLLTASCPVSQALYFP